MNNSPTTVYEMSPFDNVLYFPNNIDVRLCPKNGMSSIKEVFRIHKQHDQYVGRSYRYWLPLSGLVCFYPFIALPDFLNVTGSLPADLYPFHLRPAHLAKAWSMKWIFAEFQVDQVHGHIWMPA